MKTIEDPVQTLKKRKKRTKAKAQAKATIAEIVSSIAKAETEVTALLQPEKKPSSHVRGEVKVCPHCPAGSHMGDPASEKTLAELSPEAAVYFDRDVGSSGAIDDLCGPRFRITNGSLFAHFGSPAGGRYVVFCFDPAANHWKMKIGPHDQREHHARLLSRRMEAP